MPKIINNLTKAEPFFVQFGDMFLHGDLLLDDGVSIPDILFLHGDDKKGSRQDFFILRQVLLIQYGISSCAFDFVGHGNTSGRYSPDIDYRSRQVLEIIDACFDCNPFSMVAAAGSAPVAYRLIGFSPEIRRLIILGSEAPAVPGSLALAREVLYLPDDTVGSSRAGESGLGAGVGPVPEDSARLAQLSKKMADFLVQASRHTECKEV